MAALRPQLFPSSLRTISTNSSLSPLRCALSKSRGFHNAAVLQQGLRASTQSAPSMRVMISKSMQDNLPSDLGLLPQTFIMPKWNNRPSLFKNPKDRLALTKGFIKSKLGSLLEMIIFKWKSPMKLVLSEPKADFAKSRYQEMYQHLAEGDLEKLKKITGSGLLEKLRKQIMARPHFQHQKLVWSCRNLKAKRVSNRAFHFWGQAIEMRQAVYRIESYQQLKKVKLDPRNSAKIIGDAPGKQSPERKVVEYVVLQKKKVADTPETNWYLWGTVDETTPDQYRHMVKTQSGKIA